MRARRQPSWAQPSLHASSRRRAACSRGSWTIKSGRERRLGLGSRDPFAALLSRLIEIPQIRRRLVLARWHQHAITAQIIEFAADADQRRAIGAIGLNPI